MTFVRARENESEYMEACTNERTNDSKSDIIFDEAHDAPVVGEDQAALSRGLAPRYGSPWRHRLGTLRANGPSRKSSSNGPAGSHEKPRPQGLKRGLSVTDTPAGGPRRTLFAQWYHREIPPRRLTTERVSDFSLPCVCARKRLALGTSVDS